MDSIIFDIDGTICKIKNKEERYEDMIPNMDIVNKIKELKLQGFKIILFTSRNMRTYNGNLDQILKYTRPIIIDWLNKWNIPYDELIFGKPWPGHNGFYVDDRTIRPQELLTLSLEEINNKILEDRIK